MKADADGFVKIRAEDFERMRQEREQDIAEIKRLKAIIKKFNTGRAGKSHERAREKIDASESLELKELRLRMERCDVFVLTLKVLRTAPPQYLRGMDDTVEAFMDLLKGKL